MTTSQDVVKLTSPRAILSFPHLFTPYLSDDDRKLGRKAKFSCSLLFDAAAQATAEFAKLKAEANRVAKEKWGDLLPDMVKNGDFHSPFLSGDKYAVKYPEQGGKIVLRVSSTVKPGIVDQMVRPVQDESAVYSGLIVIASLNCYAYAPTKERPQIKKGVSFGLRNMQIVEAGTPLGNRTRPEDDFVPLEGAVTAGGADPDAMF